MNKLLFLIPVLCLVGAGILLIQVNQTPLSVDNNDVTLAQYSSCVQDNVDTHQSCMEQDTFKQVYNQYIRHEMSDSDCYLFRQYYQRAIYLNEFYTSALNQDQYYEKCYTSPKILEIAKTNFDCLYQKIVLPQLKCSGLNI
ncbi:transmembrane protein, putative (macronuclear) [Tetrahymena thermophila SB210]|uniref:Transmembrane protein, putative n=1 Tax=Tetrahymena thermophila (strain SB210) TaxID=312017 RepID=Q22EA7_TETTS|nr:transmembrane protein, putative [Tetrahymena thermophila SB210]EAR83621.1 transmembrane protein, putative [Tetrahymena thermophila SB210]|eukprot:XP_001031284.1 transmembrane protein, putative [Tetrahymena thermophila SB210]